MERGPTLSREKRAQIVALRNAGLSVRRIAQQLQCSKSTVQDAIRRHQETGSNRDHQRSGRPRISTARDDAYLCQLARRRRKTTARVLYGDWIPVVGRQLSIQTVRRRLV
jgi:transposase